MLVKQLSVFIENSPGKLLEVLDVLKRENIDIRALSIADTADFGILRLILSNPDLALEVLRNSGFTVSITSVLAIQVSDKPGGFHTVLKLLTEQALSVEYCYAFISHAADAAHVILRADKTDVALKVLQAAGYEKPALIDEIQV